MFEQIFAYDGSGNQTKIEYEWVNPENSNDVRLVTTRSFYHADNRIIRTVDPDGNEITTLYNAIGKALRITDIRSNSVVNVYDARGNLIETTHADGTVTRTVYDGNGRAVVVTDRYLPGSPAHGTRTTYDAVGRIIRTERLANVVVDIVNQGAGLKSQIAGIGALIFFTENIYDPAGRVIESIDAEGRSTRYEYDTAGQHDDLTDYDHTGQHIGSDRQTAVVDALSNRTTFGYDALGNLTNTIDALQRETRYEYDALGRRIKTIFADGSFTETSYNELGHRVAETDQAGHIRAFQYDLKGRLTNVVIPAVADPENGGLSTMPRYGYEDDPKNRETRFTYDEQNRPLGRTLPMGQTETQSYDKPGSTGRENRF